MQTIDTLIGSLVEAAAALGRGPDQLPPDLAERLRQHEADLAACSEQQFAQARSAAVVRVAIASGQAAVALGVAAKALETAGARRGGALGPQVAAVHMRIAHANVLESLSPLARLLAFADPLPQGPRQAAPVPPPAGAAAADDAALRLNIAHYHREHERYYVQERSALAAELFRDANRLKVLAGAWQQGAPAPRWAADFADPAYAPVGCTDLNALQAIATIGVLLMEGEGEPIEIRTLKARWAGMAGHWRTAGEWLSGKMDAAWNREAALYAPERIGIAASRYATIVVNWRGARERLLAGRALGAALALLDAIAFTPPALRARLAEHGAALSEAAEMLSLTAQLVGRTVADLAENDADWSACIAGLRAHGALQAS